MFLETELRNKITHEIQNLAIIFIIGVIIFKIVFLKENLLFIIKVISSFFWMFILPGFIFMYKWYKKIDFLERFIISVPVSAALVSITSYYISLMGLHAKYHPILVPAFWIVSSFIFISYKKI